MDPAHLHLDEVFLSLQGEGLEVGRPHLFMRLGGCPLRCTYCDTPRSWKEHAEWELILPQGPSTRSNPVKPADLDAALEELLEAYGLVSEEVMLAVTGGEPMVQAAFLATWLPRWKGEVLLETAGIEAEALGCILPEVDLLSLDWKLPSTLRSGQEHLASRACLELAAGAEAQVQVKLVLAEHNTDLEVAEALAAIAEVMPGTTVFLQPVTPFAKGPLPPSADRLLQWSLAHRDLPCTLRVLPQVHPLLGAR